MITHSHGSILNRITDFVNYMNETETDELMILKFIKQLPAPIMAIYQKELKSLDKKQQTA